MVNSTFCSLPSYPSPVGNARGPVVLQFLEDQQVLAACGRHDNKDNQSCYKLVPGSTESWQPMSSQLNGHCPLPSRTRSHYDKDSGWYVIGQDEECSLVDADISTELYTTSQNWTKTPTVSPYPNGFARSICSMSINNTHLMFIGGVDSETLSSSWMLDLTDYSWTPLKDLPRARESLGCTMTADNEVLVAGGLSADINKPTVYIYNIESNTWRRTDNLPDDMEWYQPVMFLWNDHPVLLENFSSRIWRLSENGWTRMDAYMGATFIGGWNTYSLVPNNLFKCQ